MKIVHINLFDAYGGAARMADELIIASRRKGHLVHQFAFEYTKKEDAYTLPIAHMPEAMARLYVSQESAAGIPAYFAPYLMSIVQHPVFQEADIVHLHCINGGYFSFLLLPFMGRKKLVWTFHDTMAYTAHCLYPHFCNRWQADYCSECPYPQGVTYQRELFQKIKENIINIISVTVVAPSCWIQDMAAQSIFKQKDIRLIYNGVDTEIYHPYDKQVVRKKHDLPSGAFILMFAAHGGVHSGMKGGQHMVSVLKEVVRQCPEIVFLHVGGGTHEALEQSGAKVVNYPYIEDRQKMAELYSAADLFVSTSLTESFGLTVCEAMASGVPVASFAAGGLAEIIEDGKSGWLTALRDEKSLTNVIVQAIRNPNVLAAMGQSATKRVREKFAMARCCDEYEDLYREIMGK